MARVNIFTTSLYGYFALNRFSIISGEIEYNDMAISMAESILAKFMTGTSATRPRIFWKMSMDLSRPLVASEGNLDPIDGYLTYKLLRSTHGVDSSIIGKETVLLKKIVDSKVDDYDSSDALDIGMTLWTAHWFNPEEEWARRLTRRALACLKVLIQNKRFDGSTARRLAFREFGTALGVNSVVMGKTVEEGLYREDELVDAEVRKLPDQICAAWEQASLVPTPTQEMQGRMAELMPITAVVYASTLIPGVMCRQS